MQKNEYLVAKIGFDTAENGPRKECCVVAARHSDWGERERAADRAGGAEAHLQSLALTPAEQISRLQFFSQMINLYRARSPLYRSKILQPNTHFAAFFEIYKII